MKIAFMGDVMLGRLVNKMLRATDPAYPWGDTLSILKNVDLRICNLECVLSDIGNPWSSTPKMFHFRSDEKNVGVLQAAQINIVSLANNHVLDYEDEALLRMIEVLDANKILHAGVGRNIQEASQPVICKTKDQKIGLIAFTDNEPGWEASENKPGIFYLPTITKDKRVESLLREIQDLKQELDMIIISAHWGPNWGYEPPREHISFAHALIDAGADLIFGHSGHICRGIEIYKNCPIIYCAGDFIDDYAVDEIEKNDESCIFVVEKGLEGNKLYLYPTYITEFQANLATPPRQQQIFSKIEGLCKNLGTKVNFFPNYLEINI